MALSTKSILILEGDKELKCGLNKEDYIAFNLCYIKNSETMEHSIFYRYISFLLFFINVFYY